MKIRFQVIGMLLIAGMVYSQSNARACGELATSRCGQTGRSVLWTRPLFQSNMPEMISGFREGLFHAKNDEGCGSFQLVLFGSKSRNNDNLQRYFTPFGLSCLTVDEATPDSLAGPGVGGAYTPQRNVYAQYFNLITNNENYRSTIAFHAHQSQVGLGMHYRKEFWRCPETDRAWFVSASTPLTSVRNSFSIEENIQNDGGGVFRGPGSDAIQPVGTMTQAFAQSAWNYGKIATRRSGNGCSGSTMHRTGLADIELKLGFEWLAAYRYHAESYVGLLVPTGNRNNAEYIFQPIVGAGGHVGLMWGTYLGALIWENGCGDRTVRYEGAFHSQYLLSNHQTRSLDLKNRPYSRYIQLYESKEQATQAANLFAARGDANVFQARNLATPGINLLTRRVKVTPGFMFNMTSALVFSCKEQSGWQEEIGYNLFFRQADCVALACPWQVGPAIKHDDGSGRTLPIRSIPGFFLKEDPAGAFGPQEALANYDYNRIQESDLDLTSAAQPSIMTYTLYGYLGYQWFDRECPLTAGLGGSVEFAQGSPGAVERWVAWAKVGVTF